VAQLIEACVWLPTRITPRLRERDIRFRYETVGNVPFCRLLVAQKGSRRWPMKCLAIATVILITLSGPTLAQGSGGSGGSAGGGSAGTGGNGGASTSTVGGGDGNGGSINGTSVDSNSAPGKNTRSRNGGTSAQGATERPGVGTAPNGRPIGSHGSGLGSPERPY
jgi:hypothetical protein